MVLFTLTAAKVAIKEWGECDKCHIHLLKL